MNDDARWIDITRIWLGHDRRFWISLAMYDIKKKFLGIDYVSANDYYKKRNLFIPGLCPPNLNTGKLKFRIKK
jgi:hypothetical protein